jgi:antitoxin component YwqK of YwqJK toxin-antitoxin module
MPVSRRLAGIVNRQEVKTMYKKAVPAKRTEIIGGFTIKYHANGKTRWSKGKVVDGQAQGYWEWYRPDGTLKRSGHFDQGEPVGAWTTYDAKGQVYKVTQKKGPTAAADSKGVACPAEKPMARKRKK